MFSFLQVNFTRCSFHKKCGLEVYDNVFLSITNCTFTDCPVFYGTLIQLHYGSNLIMSGTIIDNIQTGPHGKSLIIDTGKYLFPATSLLVNLGKYLPSCNLIAPAIILDSLSSHKINYRTVYTNKRTRM